MPHGTPRPGGEGWPKAGVGGMFVLYKSYIRSSFELKIPPLRLSGTSPLQGEELHADI